MTLEQIDQLLQRWKNQVDAIAQNLVELHNIPSYEFLIGTVGSPKMKLAGETATRVGPAVNAAECLLRDFGTLSDVVQRAVGLRQQISRFSGWGSDQRLREIYGLLTQRHIPFMSPGSTDLAGTMLTPQQLLEKIQNSFRVAHTALSEVDRIWKQLDAKLQRASEFLHEHGNESSVEPLRKQVDQLKTSVICDPLGADRIFDAGVQPVLTRVQAALAELVQQRANISENLLKGRDLLRKLVELRREAESLFAECKEKIQGIHPPTPPLPPDRIAALYEWLTRLEGKLAEGYVDPVCVGLENWMGHVNQLISVEERACMENRSPLEMRRELRGRLSALRAKARARGLGEDHHLAQVAERADELLHARPTPMKEVGSLVAIYESRVNAPR